MAGSAYGSVSAMSTDGALTGRVTACAAVEQTSGNPPTGDPGQWAWEHRWEWASTPGWAAAWDIAAAAGNPDPGGDGAVITDGMILTRVQQLAGGS